MNSRQVEYLITGGVAVNLYGYIRATMDLDILIMLDDTNTSKFIKIIKELGYKPRIPVLIDDFCDPTKRKKWVNEKNMKVFSVYNPSNEMEHVDILIKDNIDFRKAFNRREIVKSDAIKINLINIDDLIKLKEIAGRERDKIDIKALLKIKELKNEE